MSTTSLLDVPQGVQTPRIEHLPAGTVTSSAVEAIELAASVGLILDPWQCRVLDCALGERADGRWSAFECCLIVPRQNGKGSVLEALELAALFLFKERLIVHSAHEFKTAGEHFRRMRSLISRSDELSARTEGRIRTATGHESIETDEGCRLLFVARSRGSARGFTADRLVLDEAFNLSVDAMGAMLPALSTVPNPQVWYASSAPHSDSLVLHKVRERGLLGTDPRLYLAEWGNEPGVELDDWDAIAASNPGLQLRISPEFIEAERGALGELGDEFLRERLGVPAAMDAGATVFGPGRWAACVDEHSSIEHDEVIALDVALDMQFSSFAAAGQRADGLMHVELIERHPGTGWVAARAKQLAEKWHRPITIDPKSPTAGIIGDLEAENVPLIELGAGENSKACAAIQNAVLEGKLRHPGQGPLDAAVAGAAIRTSADTWQWARKTASVDISPLVACTIALWAAQQALPAPSVFYSF